MREMDDDFFSESDNFDTQWLHTKVNQRVISTVILHDRTVTQLRHNKPNTDELMDNIALTETDLIHFAPHLAMLCNALLTKREDVICASSEPWLPSRGSPSNARDADRKRPASTFYHAPLSSTPSPT